MTLVELAVECAAARDTLLVEDNEHAAEAAMWKEERAITAMAKIRATTLDEVKIKVDALAPAMEDGYAMEGVAERELLLSIMADLKGL